MCESLGGRPELPVPNNPYSFCGRQTIFEDKFLELCESRGGRPRLPVLNKPYGFCGRRAIFEDKEELRSCVKVEVAVLGSPSIINLMVSVDVKQYLKIRVRGLCESRGGRPGLPVLNKPYGFSGRKATVDVKQYLKIKKSSGCM